MKNGPMLDKCRKEESPPRRIRDVEPSVRDSDRYTEGVPT